MLHARSDYNRIQDPENKIPADEPVFLIRAQDQTAVAVVRHWIKLNKIALKKTRKTLAKEDYDKRQKALVLAEAHVYRMADWQPQKAADC